MQRNTQFSVGFVAVTEITAMCIPPIYDVIHLPVHSIKGDYDGSYTHG